MAIGEKFDLTRREIGVEFFDPGADIGGIARAADDGLGWRREQEVEGDEHLRNGGGGAFRGIGTGGYDVAGAGGKGLVMKHATEAQEIKGADGVGGWLGTVVVFLHPDRKKRIATGAAEIALPFSSQKSASWRVCRSTDHWSQLSCRSRLRKGRAGPG